MTLFSHFTGAIQVGTNDQFKALYYDYGLTSVKLNVFAASMTSGLLYSTLTMPFETAKNRMAFQKVDPLTGVLKYRNVVQTISCVIKREGVLSLWNGFTPYYLRCGLHTVIMFNTIEFLRSQYREYCV